MSPGPGPTPAERYRAGALGDIAARVTAPASFVDSLRP
jgi:hypothetical protein